VLGVTTGIRRGEAVALRWRNVDLNRAQIAVEESAEQTKTAVRYKPPKSGKGRTVALPASVVEELRGHRVRQAQELPRLGIRLTDDHFVVAQADGSPYQPRSLKHAFELFLAAHKLPRIRRHCSRGRLASNIRLGDLAFKCCRGVPREWTQVDVECGDSQRCPKRGRVVPGAIDHCVPDFAPHPCFHDQAAPAKSNDFIEVSPQRDRRAIIGTIEGARNAA
jgi:hypothetical protein